MTFFDGEKSGVYCSNQKLNQRTCGLPTLLYVRPSSNLVIIRLSPPLKQNYFGGGTKIYLQKTAKHFEQKGIKVRIQHSVKKLKKGIKILVKNK